jgi:hypothetical protein
MSTALPFYNMAPRIAELDRLDMREASDDWAHLRESVQNDLAVLDTGVLAALPNTRVRPGSNRGGGAHLFTYRVYEPAPGSAIDPVVVGVLIRPVSENSPDRFMVSGDIAGESSGDILFESPPREVVGRLAMTGAACDVAEILARQVDKVIAALVNSDREG